MLLLGQTYYTMEWMLVTMFRAVLHPNVHALRRSCIMAYSESFLEEALGIGGSRRPPPSWASPSWQLAGLRGRPWLQRLIYLFSEHFLEPLVARTSDLLILTQGQLWSVDGCPDLARRIYRASSTPGWDGNPSTWYVHEGTCVIAATGRDG